jgi:hypothetical protein
MMWGETMMPYFPEVYKFGEVYWLSWYGWLSIAFVVSTLWHVDKICMHWAKICFSPSYRRMWWEKGQHLEEAEKHMNDESMIAV